MKNEVKELPFTADLNNPKGEMMAAKKNKRGEKEKAEQKKQDNLSENQELTEEENAAIENGETSKIAELEDQLLRTRAEFANYKRRTEQEKQRLADFVRAEVITGVLPVIDDFERLFQHLEETDQELDRGFIEGVEIIHKSLNAFLEKQGLEKISDTGVEFDPNIHEAMLSEAVDDKEKDNKVLMVMQSGYRVGELVVRPARVKVGMAG